MYSIFYFVSFCYTFALDKKQVLDEGIIHFIERGASNSAKLFANRFVNNG